MKIDLTCYSYIDPLIRTKLVKKGSNSEAYIAAEIAALMQVPLLAVCYYTMLQVPNNPELEDMYTRLIKFYNYDVIGDNRDK